MNLYNKKVSIVIGYYNRRHLFKNTLDQFINLGYEKYNLEIIVTDDCSKPSEQLDDFVYQYPFYIKLIKVVEKKYYNPVIAYNIAISHISRDADIVIFQNPEIFHCGDIIHHAIQNVNNNEYLVYPVMSTSQQEAHRLVNNKFNNYYTDFVEKITSYEDGWTRAHKGWYIHHIHFQRYLHFLSAITKTNLDKVGGFNNDFKDGYCYDDDEFVYRISMVCKPVIVEDYMNYFGIHQWHTRSDNPITNRMNVNNIIWHRIQNTNKNNPYSSPIVDDVKYVHIKHVALFGSSGMLGNYVKKHLCEKADVKLTIFDRDTFDVMKDDISSINLKPYDVVINCVGLIPHTNSNVEAFYKVNRDFPKELSKSCNKMIHITTDCVFSGNTSTSYTETSPHDAVSDYGMSKSQGEQINATIIRTSIIGEETNNKKSLIEWVKSNKGDEIDGYTNHYWNGVTSEELSRIIYKIISENMYWIGVRHIFSPETVSKYELVSMINEVYALGIKINPKETPTSINRSLSSNFNVNKFEIIPLKQQIKYLNK